MHTSSHPVFSFQTYLLDNKVGGSSNPAETVPLEDKRFTIRLNEGTHIDDFLTLIDEYATSIGGTVLNKRTKDLDGFHAIVRNPDGMWTIFMSRSSSEDPQTYMCTVSKLG